MDKSSKRGSLHRLWQDAPSESERDRLVRHFMAAVERNKTRRRRDGDPPAALPAPVEPRPRGGGFSGGAAAALTFEET